MGGSGVTGYLFWGSMIQPFRLVGNANMNWLKFYNSVVSLILDKVNAILF